MPSNYAPHPILSKQQWKNTSLRNIIAPNFLHILMLNSIAVGNHNHYYDPAVLLFFFSIITFSSELVPMSWIINRIVFKLTKHLHFLHKHSAVSHAPAPLFFFFFLFSSFSFVSFLFFSTFVYVLGWLCFLRPLSKSSFLLW